LQVQVLDPNGAVIPNANVTVRNVGTGITHELKTGKGGTSRFDGLEAGGYKVTIAAQGFQTSEVFVAVRVAEVELSHLEDDRER
jgi:hypothetical protein